MFDMFFRKIREKISLTAAEEEIFKDCLTPRKLRKRQYLLQEGDVSKYIAFVETGSLRMYRLDEKDAEHVVQFALEGWFISDLYSFLTGEPSVYNIDAIEDSELLLMSKPAQDELMQKIPQFEHFTFLQIQAAYIALQKRITAMITLSVEDKYLDLTNTYPDIVQRVPQHMIASYLGVTPETLSRARKQLTR